MAKKKTIVEELMESVSAEIEIDVVPVDVELEVVDTIEVEPNEELAIILEDIEPLEDAIEDDTIHLDTCVCSGTPTVTKNRNGTVVVCSVCGLKK